MSSCISCGEPILVGTRGPLPRRHSACRPPDAQLLYQVRSAARLAHRVGRQAVGFELDAIAAVLQLAPGGAEKGAETGLLFEKEPPPAREDPAYTRFGE